MVLSKQITLTCIQLSSASTSLLASSAITTMIALPRNGGLSTPYRRIIFGLSIADVLQSLGFITGPFSVPSSVNPLGNGNDGTCEVNGFLVTIGSTAAPIYTCFLCFYYLCKLKWRMSDECFRRTYELYFHFLISVFSLVVPSVALGLKTYHPVLAGTFCHFALTPRGCRMIPEIVGECDPTITAHVDNFTMVISMALPFICLLIIAFIMAILYWHSLTWKRMFREETPQTPVPTPLRPSAAAPPLTNTEGRTGNDHVAEGEQRQSSSRENVQHLSRLYRKESLTQATCYVGSFLLVWVPVLTNYVLILNDIVIPGWLGIIGVIFYPLGGLFNILVYTRPMVAGLRRKHPEYPRILGLWLVFKAGGEIPEEEDIVPSLCCCADIWKQGVQDNAIDGMQEQNNLMINDEVSESFRADLASIRTPSIHVSERLSSTAINTRQPKMIIADLECGNSSNCVPPPKHRYYKLPHRMPHSDSIVDSRKLRLDNCPDISSGIDCSQWTISSREMSSFSHLGTMSLAVVVEDSQGELSAGTKSSIGGANSPKVDSITAADDALCSKKSEQSDGGDEERH